MVFHLFLSRFGTRALPCEIVIILKYISSQFLVAGAVRDLEWRGRRNFLLSNGRREAGFEREDSFSSHRVSNDFTMFSRSSRRSFIMVSIQWKARIKFFLVTSSWHGRLSRGNKFWDCLPKNYKLHPRMRRKNYGNLVGIWSLAAFHE